jgi:hypothetical protein
VAFNFVEGNNIGTSAGRQNSQGNVLGGILIYAAHDTTIGDALTRRNIINGNVANGLTLDGGAYSNVLSGNYIGDDPVCCSLGNGARGVVIQGGAHDNAVGKTGTGLGNVISANTDEGVLIGGANTANNILENNFISGNTIAGVFIGAGAHDNTLGVFGHDPNTIIYTLGDGVFVGSGAFNNKITNDYIGSNINGDINGNTQYGLVLQSGAHDNLISYTIAKFSGKAGILIDGGNTTSNFLYTVYPYYNTGNGVELSNGAHDNLLESFIVYANQLSGVVLSTGAHNNHLTESDIDASTRHGIILSGTGTTGNVISNTVSRSNNFDGINEGGGAANNVWTHISTHNNKGLGIDRYALDDANNSISPPFPIIRSVQFSGGQVTVTGTASASTPIIESVKVELYNVATNASG